MTDPSTIAKGLTEAQRKAVKWFVANGPAALFGRGDPSLRMVKKLHDMTILETQGTEPGVRFGCTMYGLTDLGRAVAAELMGE